MVAAALLASGEGTMQQDKGSVIHLSRLALKKADPAELVTRAAAAAVFRVVILQSGIAARESTKLLRVTDIFGLIVDGG